MALVVFLLISASLSHAGKPLLKFYEFADKIIHSSALFFPTASAATWDELSNADGLFPSSVNAVKSSLDDEAGVLAELKSILDNTEQLSSLYQRYVAKYGEGGQSDTASRLPIFRSAVEDIVKHNLEARKGQHSWVKGVNFFADKVGLRNHLLDCSPTSLVV